MTSTSTLEVPKSLNPKLLSDEQKQSLLNVAANLIGHFASGQQLDQTCLDELGELKDQHVFGIFTTLKRGKQLRGCCGSMGEAQSLGEHLFNACRRTALEDGRMPAISPYELPYLALDISVLEKLEPIEQEGRARLTAFEIGKHGLVAQQGRKADCCFRRCRLNKTGKPSSFCKASVERQVYRNRLG